jgi:hypothetical protein
MRLKPLIDKELKRAFRLLADLAVDVSFQKKKATGFNFASASVEAGDDGDVPAKVIVTKTVRGKEAVTKTIMVRSSEVGSLSLYAEVLMDDGQLWRVGEPLHDTGYILLLTVIRERKDG